MKLHPAIRAIRCESEVTLRDVDWCVYDNVTHHVVRIVRGHQPRPQAQLGQTCISGLTAKMLGVKLIASTEVTA